MKSEIFQNKQRREAETTEDDFLIPLSLRRRKKDDRGVRRTIHILRNSTKKLKSI